MKLGAKVSRRSGTKIYSLKRIKQETLARINFNHCKKIPVVVAVEPEMGVGFLGRTRRQAVRSLYNKYQSKQCVIYCADYIREKSGVHIITGDGVLLFAGKPSISQLPQNHNLQNNPRKNIIRPDDYCINEPKTWQINPFTIEPDIVNNQTRVIFKDWQVRKGVITRFNNKLKAFLVTSYLVFLSLFNLPKAIYPLHNIVQLTSKALIFAGEITALTLGVNNMNASASFRGQVLPTNGNLPDSTYFYKFGEDLPRIRGPPCGFLNGYYSVSTDQFSPGDTVIIKFGDNLGNLNQKILGEIYLPNIRESPLINFPPTIHCRDPANPDGPLINFTAYRQELGAWGGVNPTKVACFIKNRPDTVLLDELTTNPAGPYEHVMHVLCQLQNPDSFRIALWREHDNNLNLYYPHFIPSQTGWISVEPNFGDVVNLNTNGISNNLYDNIWPNSLVAIPKPLDISVESVSAPESSEANKTFNVNAEIKNQRWLRSIAPCTLYVIHNSGSIVRKVAKVDTLEAFLDTVLNFRLKISDPGNYKLFVKSFANNEQNFSNDADSCLIKILEGSPVNIWHNHHFVPPGYIPGGKKCGVGTDACVDNDGKIHIIKGSSKNLEYYIYNPQKDSFVLGTNLPAGYKGKPKAGSCLFFADNHIYYKEGQGPGLWKKGKNPDDPWEQVSNSIEINGKFVKAGTDACFNDNDIYMTYGSYKRNNHAFVVKLDLEGNIVSLDSLSEEFVPKKKFQDGASIINTPYGIYTTIGQTPWLLKRISEGLWEKVADLPTTKGKFKGRITYNIENNLIYFVEGNNCQKFGSYNPSNGEIQSLQDVPLGGSSGRKKVKDPALVCLDNEIYLLRANGTNDLLGFIPSSKGQVEKEIKNTEARTIGGINASIFNAGNYLESEQNKKYEIYDVLGRQICKGNTGKQGNVYFDKNFKPGIYFLKTENQNEVKKVIIK